MASWAEVSAMEQHFLDIVKPTWDACDWAPQLQPLWLLMSENSEL